MGSNTEKKPWTNLQNLYKNWSKEIKSDNFAIAITKENKEKSNIAIAILVNWRIWTYPISPFKIEYIRPDSLVYIKSLFSGDFWEYNLFQTFLLY